MKKNIFIISGLILLLFVWTTASYAEEKIGFVNMQDILLNSNAGKRAEAEFKKIVDRKQASIKAMENEIQKMQSELEKQSAVMAAPARKAKQEAYMKKCANTSVWSIPATRNCRRTSRTVSRKWFRTYQKSSAALLKGKNLP